MNRGEEPHIVGALRDILEDALVLPKVIVYVVALGQPLAARGLVCRVAHRVDVVCDVTRPALDAKVSQLGADVRDEGNERKVKVDGGGAVGALRRELQRQSPRASSQSHRLLWNTANMSGAASGHQNCSI